MPDVAHCEAMKAPTVTRCPFILIISFVLLSYFSFIDYRLLDEDASSTLFAFIFLPTDKAAKTSRISAKVTTEMPHQSPRVPPNEEKRVA